MKRFYSAVMTLQLMRNSHLVILTLFSSWIHSATASDEAD